MKQIFRLRFISVFVVAFGIEISGKLYNSLVLCVTSKAAPLVFLGKPKW